MSVYISVCPLFMLFFKASHWPSGDMINSRPLIGKPSFTTKLSNPPPLSPLPPQGEKRNFAHKSPLAAEAAMAAGRDKKNCLKASWRRCYYPSRDALSPVCGIFFVEDTKTEFSLIVVNTTIQDMDVISNIGGTCKNY